MRPFDRPHHLSISRRRRCCKRSKGALQLLWAAPRESVPPGTVEHQERVVRWPRLPSCSAPC
jgi:hypothetical protein